jgi:cell wall-associated NlpC family hydrolase
MTLDDLEYENLLGKPWSMNVDDCFTLVINFYKQNFDIDIPNIARPTDWDADELDLIRMTMPRTNFFIVDENEELRPGDLLCVAYNSKNPNHLVIYVGNNEIIHHRYGLLSAKELYRPAWRMITGYVLRHPDVPDLRPVLPDTTLEELLRARLK